ncbi:transglycosylase SLT domain-containing protein [Klebsiella aerogenes]
MRIPTGNFGNVTPQAQQNRVAVSNVGAIGNAISGAGVALGEAADLEQRRQDKADVAATQAILTDLEAKSNDRWENPETGATVTRQGFKSSGVVADMDKADAGDYEEARKRVPSSQLNYFDAQWKAGQVRRTSTYSGFERAQTEEAQRQQLNATVTSSVEQEASAYDNPMQAGLIRSARKHSIEMYGQARGWSQERINGAVSEANQKALEQRAQNYAVTNPSGWLNGDFTLVNSSTGELDMRAVIQYVTPAEQQAELAKVKPQANDPDYALKLDAYGKLSALVQKSNANIQAQRDSARFNDALISGEKLDPSNKSMQKAADNTPSALNFRINDATTHDAIVQQVNQTGIIPSQVTSQLNAIARSSSPDVVKQGSTLFNALYETDPASVGDMPKDMQSFYLTVKQLTDSGMASDEAVKQAQNVTYNQTDALKLQLSSTQSTKEYKKERASAMDSAVSSMKPWYSFGGPAADDQNLNAVNFRNDYQSLYDINYRNSGGNADVAKKMTNTQISRTWSLSDVNGSAQFMKYAPEALYNYGPSGWQAAQWKEEKERLAYGERGEKIETSPTQLGITSGSAPVITSNTPESRIGGELEITPDVLTTRNGDYAIMVRMKDKDGNESVQPYYDKFGRLMRWKPSLEDWEPYKKMQQEREQQGEEEISRGKDIRGFKEKHRALDEQYQRLHDDRMNRVKNYFSWSNE